jgi:hypothetical protein
MAPRVKMVWIMHEAGWAQAGIEGSNHSGKFVEDIQEDRNTIYWVNIRRYVNV